MKKISISLFIMIIVSAILLNGCNSTFSVPDGTPTDNNSPVASAVNIPEPPAGIAPSYSGEYSEVVAATV